MFAFSLINAQLYDSLSVSPSSFVHLCHLLCFVLLVSMLIPLNGHHVLFATSWPNAKCPRIHYLIAHFAHCIFQVQLRQPLVTGWQISEFKPTWTLLWAQVFYSCHAQVSATAMYPRSQLNDTQSIISFWEAREVDPLTEKIRIKLPIQKRFILVKR